MSRIYRRTIEGWRLEGDDAWVMPVTEQCDAWDALAIAEQDRITDKFALAIADEFMHDDLTVLPGEWAYEQWKADRQKRGSESERVAKRTTCLSASELAPSGSRRRSG